MGNRILARYTVSFILIVNILLIGDYAVHSELPNDNNTSEQSHPQDVIELQRLLLDDITAIVHGPVTDTIITRSDLEYPGVDGVKRSVDALETEALIVQGADLLKMIPTDAEIEADLSNVRAENNLTPDELKEIFKAAGYSEEHGRKQFGNMRAISQIIGFKVGNRIVISEDDINRYYNENSEITPARYQLSHVVVVIPVGASVSDRNKIKQQLIIYTKNGVMPVDMPIVWSNPYWLENGEIAEDKSFIHQLELGDIATPYDSGQSFVLFKLVDKHKESKAALAERHDAIANRLRELRYKELMAEYKKELFENASIVYL